jgi:hypothetical protein
MPPRAVALGPAALAELRTPEFITEQLTEEQPIAARPIAEQLSVAEWRSGPAPPPSALLLHTERTGRTAPAVMRRIRPATEY